MGSQFGQQEHVEVLSKSCSAHPVLSSDWTLILKYNFHSFRCFIPNWPSWESAHFSWLKWGPTNPIWESAYFCLLFKLVLSKLLHGFLYVVKCICRKYTDFSSLLHGIVKIDPWISLVVTWSCQSCKMYFLHFAKQNQSSWSLGQNLSKLLIWTTGDVWVKALNALGP